MTNDVRRSGAHSAEYFGASRDFWWNRDFLALVGARLGLAEARRVLDVGCGLGHWGRCLAPVLPPEARIVGIDADHRWAAEARSPAGTLRGQAEALPFADDAFDLVTCQTVLIHLRDPRAGLAEMIRVARPGGLVLVAEPNNRANALVLDSTLRDAPQGEIGALLGFQMTCERGKTALGLGDNSLGDRVPGLFAALGLEGVRVWLNDKASPLLPGRLDPEARALAEELAGWAGRDFWCWGRAETRRYFDAGGGAPEAFERLWDLGRRHRLRQAAQLAAGTYEAPGGALTYLVAGRKPEGSSGTIL